MKKYRRYYSTEIENLVFAGLSVDRNNYCACNKSLAVEDFKQRFPRKLHSRAIKFISGARLSRAARDGETKMVIISGVSGSDSCFRITTL